jgi:L-Ala-D/L-Glu epimerase
VSFSARSVTLDLQLRQPFVIARRASHSLSTTTVLLELRSDAHPGVVGLGEGFPEGYYGETPETIAAVVPRLLEALQTTDPLENLEAASRVIRGAIGGNGAAKCAIDLALHDWVGKVQERAVVDLLGLSRTLPPTDFTIGIDTPASMAERAAAAARFPALKVKVGAPSDVEALEAVRGVYDGPIRVDANTGWTAESALSLLPDLERLGVELIEQPFRPRQYESLRRLQEHTSIPIVADESAVTEEDLDALDGVVRAVNVKVAKCGGVGAAKAMLQEARDRGFQTMLGCMEETSLAISAAACVASLADWVDLDGNLLLANDPIAGLTLDDSCRWILPDEESAGFGVVVAPGSHPAFARVSEGDAR